MSYLPYRWTASVLMLAAALESAQADPVADFYRGKTVTVINGGGVIGRVIGNPSSHASTVQLLIDRTAFAGAILEASGSAGGVSGGFADGNYRLGLLSSAATVAVGDRVVTSGQDGIFPHGFLIGTVQQINGTGKSREVVVTPAVNFERLDVVLILLAKPAEPEPPTGSKKQ